MDNIIPNTDVVVARYKENIDWIKSITDIPYINNIYIYQKFHNTTQITHKKIHNISLPNVGRESNTYLYHIINNYLHLNQYTIFLQGEPSPHIYNIDQHIFSIQEKNISTIYPFNIVLVENEQSRYRYSEHHSHGLFLAYFMDILFDITLDIDQTVNVSYGAQFVVNKNAILSRPVEFYQYLNKLVSRKSYSVEPYIFERLWLYIFNPNIPISDTYKNWTC